MNPEIQEPDLLLSQLPWLSSRTAIFWDFVFFGLRQITGSLNSALKTVEYSHHNAKKSPPVTSGSLFFANERKIKIQEPNG